MNTLDTLVASNSDLQTQARTLITAELAKLTEYADKFGLRLIDLLAAPGTPENPKPAPAPVAASKATKAPAVAAKVVAAEPAGINKSGFLMEYIQKKPGTTVAKAVEATLAKMGKKGDADEGAKIVNVINQLVNKAKMVKTGRGAEGQLKIAN